MHLNGYNLVDGRKRNAKDAYDGKSTLTYAPIIKKIIKTKKEIKLICICTIKDDGKIKHIPLQYGCKINNY